MSVDAALLWTERLTALALVLQSLELLQLRSVFADDGVWRWSILREEQAGLLAPLRWVLALFLPYRPFVGVLVGSGGCVGGGVCCPPPPGVLVGSGWVGVAVACEGVVGVAVAPTGVGVRVGVAVAVFVGVFVGPAPPPPVPSFVVPNVVAQYQPYCEPDL